uniref:Serine/threonine-protein phosphatase 1 regulatory subunit 10 (Trinotate prediction) n=1 Tax=Myxobolus squamalis TaxID=59785 RepID=A0A6B2FWT4_MYXSQ
MISSENSRKRRVCADASNNKKPVNLTDHDSPICAEDSKEINHATEVNADCAFEGDTPYTDDISILPLSKRRSVSFKDDSLVEIFYFEMTNQERLEMHGERTQLQFDEARHLNSLEEKNAIKKAKVQNEDKDMSHEWSKSVLLEEILPFKKGSQSEEKDNQSLRESNILAPIFIEKTRIPDSPSEPHPNDSISKNDDELNLSYGPHESSVICIAYWENFVYPPVIPQKIFYPPINDNTRDNFITHERFRHNTAQFSRNPGYRPTFRPKTYRPRNEFNNAIHQVA